MIYDDEYSLLLATGLSLREIGELISPLKGLSPQGFESWLKNKGEKYYERYLTYREYRELTGSGRLREPILPLFAAVPGVGKTTMAREVATSLGIGNVMGGDAFRAALRAFVSKKENPFFFSSVYSSWKFFGELTEENIIKGFEAQAEIMNRAMERVVVDRGIRDGESMVYEYLHFLPQQFNIEVLNHPSVIPVVLRLDSEEIHRERIKNRVRKTHLKGGARRLLDVLDIYRIIQDYQCEQARRYSIPVISTDEGESAFDRILDIIFERIKRLVELGESGIGQPSLVENLEKERTDFNTI